MQLSLTLPLPPPPHTHTYTQINKLGESISNFERQNSEYDEKKPDLCLIEIAQHLLFESEREKILMLQE